MTKIKLGVAFAGGGTRGAGHFGIIQALQEEGIYPEIYAGTSAGSIVAGLLAYGYTPEQALNKFLDANKGIFDVAFMHILKGSFTKNKVEGFVAGNKLERILDTMFNGDTLSTVKNPLGIVTTDIDKGKQVIFSNMLEGADISLVNDRSFLWCASNTVDYKLSEIIRASSGIPPVFIPKRINDMKLVDGGITNNLPSDVVWALGADKVLSLDLGYAGEVETRGFIDVSHMAINLLMKRVTDGNSQHFGMYVNPHIYDVSSLDTGRVQECFDRGYVHGKTIIGEVIKMLEEPVNEGF